MQYDQVTLTNYSYLFQFELEFIPQRKRRWMIENWTLSFYCVSFYLVIIFGGQYLMRKRPRFELRAVLSLWNIVLAIFSIIGFARTVPEFMTTLTHNGLYHSVCVPSNLDLDKVSGFWTWMFVLSKLPELGDTLFIVLRKQPLIFLHWYHHCIAIIYFWLTYSEFTASARWFVVMNYFVHSIMYSYFTLRSMGYSRMRQTAMVITSLQLVQMFVGCAVNILVIYLFQKGTKCCVSKLNVMVSLGMYFSFIVLFSRFFYKTYLPGNSRKSRSTLMTTGYLASKSKQN